MAKILVIDDSPFIFKMVKKALTGTEHEVLGHARNGKEGIEKIKELNPDLVTLDVTMPVMDGIETLKAISEEGLDVKILMLSAMGDQELLDKAKELGATDFISKPFKANIFKEKVGTVLNS